MPRRNTSRRARAAANRAAAARRIAYRRLVQHQRAVALIAASLHRSPALAEHSPNSNEPARSGNPAGSTTTTNAGRPDGCS